MKIYNKLVRDKIPHIIQETGKSFESRNLSPDEFRVEARKKLQEEVLEYMNALDNENSLEELADILELMNVLAQLHGSTLDHVEELRMNKVDQRGAFEDKVYLVSVGE